MRISFHSVSQDENIHFETELNIIDNILIFKDNNGIMTNVVTNDNEVQIIRDGSVSSTMLFIEGQVTKSIYTNDMGLEFEFYIDCKKLLVTKNKILIEYSLILDGNILNNYKIWLLIH